MASTSFNGALAAWAHEAAVIKATMIDIVFHVCLIMRSFMTEQGRSRAEGPGNMPAEYPHLAERNNTNDPTPFPNLCGCGGVR
jgi:hypothetical protein